MENASYTYPYLLKFEFISSNLRRSFRSVVVAKEGEKVDKKSVLEILKENFTNWQLPHNDDIRLIEAIPKTSAGKFDKKLLRSGMHSGKY